MILLIDNYDSFSYNVYQLTASINPEVKVIRNDEMTVEEIEKLAPTHIILSPGPGKPSDAGFVRRSSDISQESFPFWASVWDIRQSVRFSVPR